MLPGETVSNGAPVVCHDCNEQLIGPSVLASSFGYYIGYICACGPYSRESRYYKKHEHAKKALESETWSR